MVQPRRHRRGPTPSLLTRRKHTALGQLRHRPAHLAHAQSRISHEDHRVSLEPVRRRLFRRRPAAYPRWRRSVCLQLGHPWLQARTNSHRLPRPDFGTRFTPNEKALLAIGANEAGGDLPVDMRTWDLATGTSRLSGSLDAIRQASRDSCALAPLL